MFYALALERDQAPPDPDLAPGTDPLSAAAGRPDSPSDAQPAGAAERGEAEAAAAAAAAAREAAAREEAAGGPRRRGGGEGSAALVRGSVQAAAAAAVRMDIAQTM